MHRFSADKTEKPLRETLLSTPVIQDRIRFFVWAGLKYLQPGMSVELVEEVHQQVNLQRADTQHHMLLRLSSVSAVVPSQLLALHPQVGQLFKLSKMQHKTKTSQMQLR